MISEVPAADSKRLAGMFWTLYASKNPGAKQWDQLSKKQRDDIADAMITAIKDFMGETEKTYEEFSRNCTEAKKAIVAHSAGLGFIQRSGAREGKSVRGDLPCPICMSGTLSYTRSSCNGHVHAKCSTPRCVNWRE